MEISNSFRKKILNGWALESAAIALMVALPGFVILAHLFGPPTEAWIHIREHLLWDYVITSLKLGGGVFCLSLLLGVPLAWFITVYDFPGRNFLAFGLVLPLAIPPYIGAYTYAGMFSYTGFIQTFLRQHTFLVPHQKYFDIMTLPGAVCIFALFLYPYIYMILRAFLERQSSHVVEAGKVLGRGMGGIFFSLILPLSRKAILGGATLVVLEVLSDYGVVSYFGLPVFSTAIFKAWISFSDVQSALKLSALLLLGVFLLGGAGRLLGLSRQVTPSMAAINPLRRAPLKGLSKGLVMAFSYGIFFLGVLLPAGQMGVWAFMSRNTVRYTHLGTMALNSLGLGLLCSGIILVFAIILANYQRLYKNFLSQVYARLALWGYSLPGTVVAVTMLILFLEMETFLPFKLSATIAMVVAGYLIRYLAIGFQNVERGFEKIGPRFTESARLLGCSPLGALVKVDIPMMKASLVSAFILTFVDIVKELPIVLLLRPFNFYTLSTKVFEYAHDEMIPESSVASLLIIGLSSLPMVILHLMEKKKEAL